MTDGKNTTATPVTGLWARFLVLIPLVLLLALGSYVYMRSVCSTYRVWTPVALAGVSFDELDLDNVTCETPGIVEPLEVEHFPTGAARVTFRAVSEGETMATFGSGQNNVVWFFRVQDGAIIEGDVNFSGWESIHISLCIFLAALSALFASCFIRLVREHWYDYEMIACGGGLIFCLFQCALFVALYLRNSLLSFSDMAYMVCSTAELFAMVSLAPMGLLALFVSISNISLIRHEGKRPVNLLGIAVSVVWALVNFAWLHLWSSGAFSPQDYAALELADSIAAVAISFGECLLISTMACAWLASRHEPRKNKDFLIVLGCGIRADGTPSPLLAGRVDRARLFDEKHVHAGEAPATFVPSGGQGPDEVMSEAQSMAQYLEAKGVEPCRIVCEGRSTTTRENMIFSREVIEEHAHADVREVSVGFSTTNYHVFRGYVCAHRAGMAVEGLGSKTKAYFWPNAFLREFIGLLASQWRGILQTLVILGVVYAAAEFILML